VVAVTTCLTTLGLGTPAASATVTGPAGAVADNTADGIASGRFAVRAAVAVPAWPSWDRTPTALRRTVSRATVPSFGWVAWPLGRRPRALVVLGHPCCGVWADSEDRTRYLVQRTGAVVVQMDNHGSVQFSPDVGAQDMAAAIHVLRTAVPSIRTVLAIGASMGGESTGLLLAHHPGLVDDWVDVVGVDDLAHSYALSHDGSALGQHIGGLVLDATGGPPDSRPARFADLSPARHVAEIALGAKPRKGSYLRHVYVFHGAGDAIAPVGDAISLARALSGAGVPASLTIDLPADGQPTSSDDWHFDRWLNEQAIRVLAALAAGGQPDGKARFALHQHVGTLP
jgi:hypothetical protein